MPVDSEIVPAVSVSTERSFGIVRGHDFLESLKFDTKKLAVCGRDLDQYHELFSMLFHNNI